MRMLFRSTAVALATTFALLVSGCASSEPVITPEPSPTSTPVFASDEEALAAATEAYAAYLAMSDQIAQDGGTSADRIGNLVTAAWLPKEIQQFSEFAKSGYHQSGVTHFDHLQLQRFGQDERGTVTVTFYVCLDFSETKVLDNADLDVTPRDLDVRAPFEVSFESSKADSVNLLLSGMERWQSTNFC